MTPGKFNPLLVPVVIKSIRVIDDKNELKAPECIYPPVSKEYTGNAS